MFPGRARHDDLDVLGAIGNGYRGGFACFSKNARPAAAHELDRLGIEERNGDPGALENNPPHILLRQSRLAEDRGLFRPEYQHRLATGIEVLVTFARNGVDDSVEHLARARARVMDDVLCAGHADDGHRARVRSVAFLHMKRLPRARLDIFRDAQGELARLAVTGLVEL